ncbi:MAG: type II toxin-antitoxin system PemK/MazF family toxin [Candidatus Vogelbacteria bacterium]|nr:type II toxin-antitoxin system PemK/MazF family toxin [Candidatus Vogelbacteria bacterium]
MAVLSQIRFVDRKRLAKKIATLNESTFQKLTAQIIEVCFPDRNK